MKFLWLLLAVLALIVPSLCSDPDASVTVETASSADKAEAEKVAAGHKGDDDDEEEEEEEEEEEDAGGAGEEPSEKEYTSAIASMFNPDGTTNMNAEEQCLICADMLDVVSGQIGPLEGETEGLPPKEIYEILEHFCENLELPKAVEQKCEAYVKETGMTIAERLHQKMDHRKICESLNFCTSDAEAKKEGL